LTALFVAAMVLVAPVFASSNDDNNNGVNEIVCVRYNYDDGDKDYRWIYEKDWEYGDEVVADKYCENYDHDNYDPNMPRTPPPVVPPPLLS
jgi:hypothetical protein